MITDNPTEREIMKSCKHKFKPRYSEKYTTIVEELNKPESRVTEIKGGVSDEPYLKEKIYIHDICVKCGQIAGKT